ncbi:hypothetical protein SNEBB_004226 [Seison nebaliae]|nr:hypothetical protein SNEBB_004226 [Seison nebaliae]
MDKLKHETLAKSVYAEMVEKMEQQIKVADLNYTVNPYVKKEYYSEKPNSYPMNALVSEDGEKEYIIFGCSGGGENDEKTETMYKRFYTEPSKKQDAPETENQCYGWYSVHCDACTQCNDGIISFYKKQSDIPQYGTYGKFMNRQ